MTSLPRKKSLKKHNYKSNFEAEFAKRYPQVKYESDVLEYHVVHKYHPDWKIKENTYIETKGLWTAQDRAKHLHIKEQHPEVTVYLVFMNPRNKLSRVSKTTYGEWATKHGIPWATLDTIPEEWFK